MSMFRSLLSTLVPAIVLSAGCSDANLPGHRFDVTLTEADNGCTGESTPAEDYTYRVEVQGAAVTLSIGEDLLATGTLSGCNVRYDSPPWTESRSGGEVRWSMSGEAVIALGDGCAAESGWVGTETITVLESSDADVQGGCRFTHDVDGTYEGLVE